MLRPLTRACWAATALCLATASWLTFLVGPASARTFDPIVIRDGESILVDYPMIPVSNPNSGTTPEDCFESQECDVIPLDVVVDPDRDPEDDYFLEIKLMWETDKVPDNPVFVPIAYQDMDQYVYVNPATRDEVIARGHATEEDADDDGMVTSAAGYDQPEYSYLTAARGSYYIVVVNYRIAREYQIQVTWFNESVPTPFESLAPEFAPPETTTTTTTTTPPPTTTTAPATTTTTAPTINRAEIDTQEFDLDQFDDSDFDDALAAPRVIPLGPVSAGPPSEPSPLALAFWLLAVPLGALALLATVVLRRRPVL